LVEEFCHLAKLAKSPVFTGLFVFLAKMIFCGIVVALARVGQRDTRWLNPLTVSAVTKGEEGNRAYQALTGNPTTVSAYFFF